MRTETVPKTPGTAEQVIGKLVEKAEDNPELLDLQATMLHEFAQTYSFKATRPRRTRRRGMRSPLPTAWPTTRNASWQHALSIAYDELGDALQAQGDLTGALKSYQKKASPLTTARPKQIQPILLGSASSPSPTLRSPTCLPPRRATSPKR